MKNVLLPGFILGAVSSAAVAEPLPLADAQMDAITAGQVGQVDQTDAFVQQATALSAQTVEQIERAPSPRTRLKWFSPTLPFFGASSRDLAG